MPSSRFMDRLVQASLVLVPLAFGLLSLSFGQDANWDLRNYHWYNPYAFLTHRLGQDLGPAHIATFYNPALDLPLFFAGQVVPARVMGFLLGVIHGLNYVPLFFVARVALASMPPVWPTLSTAATAAIVAFVGVIGGGHLGIVGTTFNDNLVSLLLLGAGALLVCAPQLWRNDPAPLRRGDVLRMIGAGALIGLAVGFKLPSAPFAVGFCAAFLCAGGTLPRRILCAFVFGIGVLIGFAVSGGPWMWMLWRDYANPLFPYFNGIFRSPLGLPDSYRDMRFLPRSVFEWLIYPLLFSLDSQRVGEIVFQDFRILAAYLAMIATAVLVISRRIPRGTLSPVVGYLIAAGAISYAAWQTVFSIYRYAVPLEMMAPLIAVTAMAAWPTPARRKSIGVAVLLVFLALTGRRGEWIHTPWQDGPFVQVTAPAVENPDQAMALITGTNPVGWMIPAFPRQIPFVRIYGYLATPDQSNGFNDRAHALIAAHRGAFYVMFPEMEQDNAEESLTAYGLAADLGSCVPVASNLGDYVRWCRVYRSAPPAADPS